MTQTCVNNTVEWIPAEFSEKRFALLILNTEIEDGPKAGELWERASFRVLVDGGANRLHNLATTTGRNLSEPHLLTGDFDSIESEVKQLFADRGVSVVETPDQDFTDFHKALIELSKRVAKQDLDYVIVYVENSGRLDQQFSIYETLFHAHRTLADELPSVVLCSSKSWAWLLAPHTDHTITIAHKDQNCGLIPLGCPSESVTTTGLKWNLSGDRLAFGHLVSTSNTFSSNRVTVRCDQPLLWTQEQS